MDIKNYRRLKELNRIRVTKKGDKIIVETDMYDSLEGGLKTDIEILILSHEEQKFDKVKKQVTLLNEELSVYEEFLKDITK